MLIDDVDELIAVGSCVFMPESDDMSQFVDNNSELVTILSDADYLRAVLTPTHERTTPEKGVQKLQVFSDTIPSRGRILPPFTNASLKQYQECCA